MPYRLPADHYRFKPAVVRGTAANRPAAADVQQRPVIYVATDTGDVSFSTDTGAWAQLSRRDGNAITGMQATIPRTDLVSTPALVGGQINFTYFTSTVGGTFTKLRTVTGGTAAGATPTLAKMGLYTVAANGDMTLKVATANTTSLWGTINTRYDTATTASYTVAPGDRLAFAVLVVTGAALPTLLGLSLSGTAAPAEASMAPRISSQFAGQSDLPASVLDSAVAAAANLFYGVLVP